METFRPPKEAEETNHKTVIPDKEGISEKWLREKLDQLIQEIQETWPSIAKQTLEATKGSIDDLVNVIANNTGKSSQAIKNQLFEIIDTLQSNNWEIAETIEPFENQLEELLDDLNKTLRPKIETPIREKPILSIAIAAGIGLLIGTLLNNGRK